MDVARELVLRRYIQQSHIACVPASGSSDTLKGSENVGNNSTRLRGSSREGLVQRCGDRSPMDIRVVHRIVIHDDADPLETSGTQVAEDGCQVSFHCGKDLRQLSGDTRWVICALHPKQEHVVSPEADRDQPRIRVRLEEGDRKIQLRGSVANM